MLKIKEILLKMFWAHFGDILENVFKRKQSSYIFDAGSFNFYILPIWLCNQLHKKCKTNFLHVEYSAEIIKMWISQTNVSNTCLGATLHCSHLTMEKIGNLSQTISLFSIFKTFILIIHKSPKRLMKEKRISFNLMYFILLYLWYSCREGLLLFMLAGYNCVTWPVTSTYLLKKIYKIRHIT